MYDDDSRGLESPDRPHASIDNTRALPDGGDPSSEDTSNESDHPHDVNPDAASYRLEVIDHQAAQLLEALADDRTDRDRPHEATRHLREIRAEVEWVRRGLCERPSESESSAAASTDDSEESADGSEDTANDSKYITDDGVPMIVRHGPHVTTVLGPDPVAYEHSLEANDSEGDSEHEGEDEPHERSGLKDADEDGDEPHDEGDRDDE